MTVAEVTVLSRNYFPVFSRLSGIFKQRLLPPPDKKGPRQSGAFFCLAEREYREASRFDKLRKRFGPKNASERRTATFSAYGTSLCLTAKGAPQHPPGIKGHYASAPRAVSLSLSISRCLLRSYEKFQQFR
jgi:hypothetical protein